MGVVSADTTSRQRVGEMATQRLSNYKAEALVLSGHFPRHSAIFNVEVGENWGLQQTRDMPLTIHDSCKCMSNDNPAPPISKNNAQVLKYTPQLSSGLCDLTSLSCALPSVWITIVRHAHAHVHIHVHTQLSITGHFLDKFSSIL